MNIGHESYQTLAQTIKEPLDEDYKEEDHVLDDGITAVALAKWLEEVSFGLSEDYDLVMQLELRERYVKFDIYLHDNNKPNRVAEYVGATDYLDFSGQYPELDEPAAIAAIKKLEETIKNLK